MAGNGARLSFAGQVAKYLVVGLFRFLTAEEAADRLVLKSVDFGINTVLVVQYQGAPKKFKFLSPDLFKLVDSQSNPAARRFIRKYEIQRLLPDWVYTIFSWREINPAETLISPGDTLKVVFGNIPPAGARLAGQHIISVDEMTQPRDIAFTDDHTLRFTNEAGKVSVAIVWKSEQKLTQDLGALKQDEAVRILYHLRTGAVTKEILKVDADGKPLAKGLDTSNPQITIRLAGKNIVITEIGNQSSLTTLGARLSDTALAEVLDRPAAEAYQPGAITKPMLYSQTALDRQRSKVLSPKLLNEKKELLKDIGRFKELYFQEEDFTNFVLKINQADSIKGIEEVKAELGEALREMLIARGLDPYKSYDIRTKGFWRNVLGFFPVMGVSLEGSRSRPWSWKAKTYSEIRDIVVHSWDDLRYIRDTEKYILQGGMNSSQYEYFKAVFNIPNTLPEESAQQEITKKFAELTLYERRQHLRALGARLSDAMLTETLDHQSAAELYQPGTIIKPMLYSQTALDRQRSKKLSPKFLKEKKELLEDIGKFRERYFEGVDFTYSVKRLNQIVDAKELEELKAELAGVLKQALLDMGLDPYESYNMPYSGFWRNLFGYFLVKGISLEGGRSWFPSWEARTYAEIRDYVIYSHEEQSGLREEEKYISRGTMNSTQLEYFRAIFDIPATLSDDSVKQEIAKRFSELPYVERRRHLREIGARLGETKMTVWDYIALGMQSFAGWSHIDLELIERMRQDFKSTSKNSKKPYSISQREIESYLESIRESEKARYLNAWLLIYAVAKNDPTLLREGSLSQSQINDITVTGPSLILKYLKQKNVKGFIDKAVSTWNYPQRRNLYFQDIQEALEAVVSGAHIAKNFEDVKSEVVELLLEDRAVLVTGIPLDKQRQIAEQLEGEREEFNNPEILTLQELKKLYKEKGNFQFERYLKGLLREKPVFILEFGDDPEIITIFSILRSLSQTRKMDKTRHRVLILGEPELDLAGFGEAGREARRGGYFPFVNYQQSFHIGSGARLAIPQTGDHSTKLIGWLDDGASVLAKISPLIGAKRRLIVQINRSDVFGEYENLELSEEARFSLYRNLLFLHDKNSLRVFFISSFRRSISPIGVLELGNEIQGDGDSRKIFLSQYNDQQSLISDVTAYGFRLDGHPAHIFIEINPNVSGNPLEIIIDLDSFIARHAFVKDSRLAGSIQSSGLLQGARLRPNSDLLTDSVLGQGVRLGVKPWTRKSELKVKEDIVENIALKPIESFAQIFGARLAQASVTEEDTLVISKDRDELVLLARLYNSKVDILKSPLLYLFSSIQRISTIKFVKDAEGVYLGFFEGEGSGTPFAKILIPEDILTSPEAQKTLPEAEIPVIHQDLVINEKAASYGSLYKSGLNATKVTGTEEVSIVDGIPVIYSQTLHLNSDPTVRAQELRLIEESMKIFKEDFKNVYFEFFEVKPGGTVERIETLSSDILELNKLKDARRVDIDEHSKESLNKAISDKARVLFVEKSSLDSRSVDMLPYGALFIAATMVARLDKLNDKAGRFLSRLTGVSFTEERFNLLTNPDMKNLDRYTEILIRRITKIAIDQIIYFTNLALQAIGAAA